MIAQCPCIDNRPEEVPSLERGRWKVLEDGRMETTFRLRKSAVWHDGTPFTAEDVVFTWRAIMSPALAATNRTPEGSIEAIEALARSILAPAGAKAPGPSPFSDLMRCAQDRYAQKWEGP